MKKSQYYPCRFSTPTDISVWVTLRGTLRAARTVIWTPPHEDRVLHRTVADNLATHHQPPAIPLPQADRSITRIVAAQTAHWTRLTTKERMGIFAVLMQFTMYLPTIQSYFRAEYRDVEQLYRQITTKGSSKPVDFDGQLVEALRIAPSLEEALWLLLVTSRQYARWYDDGAIAGMPKLSRHEIITRMETWNRSIVALKQWSGDASHPQDSAGDAYYVWTHAIAKVVFGPMASPHSIDALFYRTALHIGTWLNHSIAHKISPQSISSDHTIAARYGNRIGTIIANRSKVA